MSRRTYAWHWRSVLPYLVDAKQIRTDEKKNCSMKHKNGQPPLGAVLKLCIAKFPDLPPAVFFSFHSFLVLELCQCISCKSH